MNLGMELGVRLEDQLETTPRAQAHDAPTLLARSDVYKSLFRVARLHAWLVPLLHARMRTNHHPYILYIYLYTLSTLHLFDLHGLHDPRALNDSTHESANWLEFGCSDGTSAASVVIVRASRVLPIWDLALPGACIAFV